MGQAVAYTVRATCPSPAVAAAYVAWLEGGHVDQVMKGGAHSAMIVRLDAERPGDEARVEVRYVFSTREVFDRYIREHAPGLRADGLKHFGPETGVRFERTVGEIL
ncbi:MAG: DUF4286 family protein [Phycisphaerales bacterium]